MTIIRVSIGRRTLIKSALALGASQAIGAPFIVKSLADEPIRIGTVSYTHLTLPTKRIV